MAKAAEEKVADVEAGRAEALYPKMAEDPRMRWAFVRKVYAVLAAQLLFTAGVAATAFFVRPIPAILLSGSVPSWALFLVILISPLIVMWPMLHFRKRHPWNLCFLALYTLCISLSVALASANVTGKIILQAVILTATVVVGLTLYTFWAARRGHDFKFLFPFLFASLLVLMVFLVIQIFFPLGELVYRIYGCLASLVFSGFIILHTDNLLKRHTYDEYIAAAIFLYLDVVNLFMSVLGLSIVVD